MSGDAALTPLAPRLQLLDVLRGLLALAVLGVAVLAPGQLGAPLEVLAAPVAGELLLAVALGTLHRLSPSWARRLRNPALLVDGVVLGVLLAVTGGPASPLVWLVAVHVVAVTLLVSYRTGLKIAAWQALLLVIAYETSQAGLPDVRAQVRDEAVLAVLGVLAIAVATAACSALNERELRRSRGGLAALADLTGALDTGLAPDVVLEVVLAQLDRRFGWNPAALLVHGVGGSHVVVRREGVARRIVVPGRHLSPAPDRQAVLRHTLPGADDALRAALGDVRNVILAPLVAQGVDLGTLVVVVGGGDGVRVPRGTIELAERVAATAALAYRNSVLLDQVRLLAATDPLTGLANRRTFELALVRELRRSDRTGAPVSLLLIDLDHFKRVNDVHGHQVGDALLRHVGALLGGRGRGADLGARYGGEEFAVVLPDCAPAAAVAIAEQLRGDLPVDAPVPCTASIGVATYRLDASDLEGLVAAADAALYRAKSGGRDRVECAARIAAA